MLHLNVMNDLSQGFEIMKYSVNHQWRFSSFKVAFLGGFLQFTVSIIVEVTNFIVILVASTEVIAIVADFLVILVISDFDDYFYSSTKSNGKFKKYITEEKYESLFEVETTTSRSANSQIEEHKILTYNHEHGFKKDCARP